MTGVTADYLIKMCLYESFQTTLAPSNKYFPSEKRQIIKKDIEQICYASIMTHIFQVISKMYKQLLIF